MNEAGELYGVLAEFDTAEDLVHAAAEVRDAKFTRWDCYSPFPVHHIEPAMGIRMTILPVIVFVAGVSGCAGGLLLQWWANAYHWKWLVSGKPFFSLPANIPITFETTILVAGITTFFALWALNKLPRLWHPVDAGRGFEKVTTDGFFLGIEAADPLFDAAQTRALLERLGATHVQLVHVDPDPVKKRVPRPLYAFIAVSTVLAIIPFALVARARVSKSDKPHIHVVPDMDFQFKYRAQQASDLFEDGRAARPQVDGTVARGELRADDHFYRGIVQEAGGPAWATRFPPGLELSPRTMERGRSRFNIYCQPCHGTAGYGDGMVDKRAKASEGSTWSPPTNLHMEHIVRQPHGQLFNTITYGIRTMPGYGGQIPEEDRWAIILYLRALQRSQLSTEADAPRGALKAPAAAAPAGAAPAGAAPAGAAPAGAAPPAATAPATQPPPAPAAPAAGAAPAPTAKPPAAGKGK